MTSSTMMWAGVLGVAGLALLWWDLVDFVLDRVGPPPQETDPNRTATPV
jgi:hypothetical protein